jgi:hypothetical protein
VRASASARTGFRRSHPWWTTPPTSPRHGHHRPTEARRARSADTAVEVQRHRREAVGVNGDVLHWGAWKWMAWLTREHVPSGGQANAEMPIGLCVHVRDESSSGQRRNADHGLIGALATLSHSRDRTGRPIECLTANAGVRLRRGRGAGRVSAGNDGDQNQRRAQHRLTLARSGSGHKPLSGRSLIRPHQGSSPDAEWSADAMQMHCAGAYDGPLDPFTRSGCRPDPGRPRRRS